MHHKKFFSRGNLDPWLLTLIGITCQVWFLFFIYLNCTWKDICLLLGISYFIGIHITLFPHRAWAHRAWVPNRFLTIYGEFVCTLGMIGNSIGWVGIHRAHHKFADTKEDPHSPLYKSKLAIQFLSYFNKVNHRFIVDIGRDKIHLWFYKNYWIIISSWLIVVFWFNFLDLWLAAIGLSLLKLHAINSLAHKTPKFFITLQGDKQATNSLILILLNINNGEAWHYNHHLNPNDYRFGHKWYEIDPPAWIINLFCLLEWASKKN